MRRSAIHRTGTDYFSAKVKGGGRNLQTRLCRECQPEIFLCPQSKAYFRRQVCRFVLPPLDKAEK